jgi:hypothetical protein
MKNILKILIMLNLLIRKTYVLRKSFSLLINNCVCVYTNHYKLTIVPNQNIYVLLKHNNITHQLYGTTIFKFSHHIYTHIIINNHGDQLSPTVFINLSL